jgi:3,4-dihydroxy 2-butanone 4-phosphate synthase / GTP cyclohydrolase II
MLGFTGSDPKASPIIVLVIGTPANLDWPFVRLQSKCTTSETFGSLHCDCSEQLDYAMKRVQDEGNGVIIYLDQEARGNGLDAKLQIYQEMQDKSITSDEACDSLGLPVDIRNYDEAASILYEVGLKQVQLLTNNPDKVEAIRKWNIDVRQVQIPITPNQHDYAYLLEKQRRHHHSIISLDSLATS